MCSFAALFSPAKRRQLEHNLLESTPRRPYLSRRSPAVGTDEEDGGFPQAGAAGYRNTNVIPVLKKTGKRQGSKGRYEAGQIIWRDWVEGVIL